MSHSENTRPLEADRPSASSHASEPVVDWIPVGCISDIPPMGARIIRLPSADVALFRTRTGRVFAIEDSCPHQHAPLSQGHVEGTQVSCPLHNLVIDLATGETADKTLACVKTYMVRRVGDNLYIRLTHARPAELG